MADGILKMLPKDLVLDILLRLPVKFLLRFKCISKIWYSLIESLIFINLHLNRTSTTNDEFVLFKSSFREAPYQYKSVLSFFSIGHDDYDLHPVSPDLNIPYPSPVRSCTSETLIGPCRGLIVITDRVMAVILNPATRNYRLLQPSPFVSPLGFHRSIDGIGFGFDSIANEYKFVRLAEVRGEPPFCCDTVRECRVEVYELSTDSWREVDNVDQELPNYMHSYTCAELFYKGATHWFANANTRIILCFDMSTETFRNMKMPNCHSKDRKCYGLVILNESLTLICYPYPGCEIDPAIDFMEIWIMKEYGVHESWSKKYRITPLAIESPHAIWKDHLLFLQSISGHLMSYDFNSDEVKEYNLLGWPKSLRVTIYKESLTLIPKGKFNNSRED